MLSSRLHLGRLLCLCLVVLFGCAPGAAPPPLSLVNTFADATIEGTPSEVPEFEKLSWTFAEESSPLPKPDDEGKARAPADVFKALQDVREPSLGDGYLRTTVTGALPLLHLEIGKGTLLDDVIDKVTVKLRSEEATRLRLYLMGNPPDEDFLSDLAETNTGDLEIDLRPGEEFEVYALGEAQSTFGAPSRSMQSLGHLVIGFDAPEGAVVDLESVQFTGQVEALSNLPSGFGWRGLGGVFRETVVSRAPESVTWKAELEGPTDLELHVGTPGDHPVTFTASVAGTAGSLVERTLTVTEKNRWFDLSLDLSQLGGSVEVSLAMAAEDPGRLGFWGTPTIRHDGSAPAAEAPTEARAALEGSEPPKGVIVFIADTLRTDHLDAWGYDRETAPFLTSLAAEGMRFDDNVAQGTWTKIAVPSILTSLYASTHGIVDAPDRIPASVTTLAEVFRDAGYATFHTSSVIFSGKNSNLQQGVEVLHERSSLDLGDYGSKTARAYVDEFLGWLQDHKDQPFFAVVHVFDPHSPFQPRRPFDRRWIGADDHAALGQAFEDLREHTDFHGLPEPEHLEKIEFDRQRYVDGAHAWYDGSIRAMDAEIARLFEQLGQHGLADDTLFAFITDHGEEFFEHGESWHGQSVYGEMVNVPMMVHWPGVVPAHVVETTSQSIDLMPTLLELARLPVPEQVQGNSHVPLMAALSTGQSPGAFGWAPRPAFTERKDAPSEAGDGFPDAYAVIDDGWKLIWNVVVRDDRPEWELFEHRTDPLNLTNVVDQHPDRVATLRSQLEGWRAMAEAAKVSDEGLEEEMDPEELERLRALGYVN